MVFHWLTKGFKEIAAELGQFVQIEDAKMREGEFAGQAAGATDERGERSAVVWGAERAFTMRFRDVGD